MIFIIEGNNSKLQVEQINEDVTEIVIENKELKSKDTILLDESQISELIQALTLIKSETEEFKKNR